MRNFLRTISVLCLLLTATLSVAEEWEQFRGGGGGKLDSIQHPLKWSADENVAWKIPMKGSGWSSPVVAGDRIYLTSAESETTDKPKGMMAGVAAMGTYRNAKPVEYSYVVSCFRLADGEPVWSKNVGKSVPPVVHPSNTYATESPVTDGKSVFTYFATTGKLTAWDLDGEELWNLELGTFKINSGFGTGSSLAINDGLLFVQHDNDEKSFIAAFNTKDGKEVWRNDRDSGNSWSTPLIWKNDSQTELITCGPDTVISYKPENGEVLWQLSGMQSGFSASPTVDAKRVYFGTSGPMSAGPLLAVDAGTSGDVELDDDFKNEKIAWSRTKSGPGMASPVIAKGMLYIPGRGGVLNCYDVSNGERVSRNRVTNMKSVAASLWADEERVFILDETGNTHVIKAGSEFEVLGTNTIDDLFWSTPAVVGESLLLRGVENLYCIRASN